MCVFTVFHSTVTIGELVLFLFKLDFYRNSKVYNVNGNEAKSMYTKSLSRIYLKFSLRPLFLFFFYHLVWRTSFFSFWPLRQAEGKSSIIS